MQRESMTSFSERYGYMPDRSKLHQLEEMNKWLRNAVWNFLWKHYLGKASFHDVDKLLGEIWTEVAGEPYDQLLEFGEFEHDEATRLVHEWFFEANWYKVYNLLEYLLQKTPFEGDRDDANAMLSREGSAYRFIGGVIAPITNEEELAEVDSTLHQAGSFKTASQHMMQAVALLSDRDSPDFRNAIKEAISAVESAVTIASGDSNADIAKGLKKLAVHSQLGQAWKNMYNWTSDEGGVRHGKEEISQVGLAEARYMVVASSAFVNYLISKSSEAGSN